MCKCGKESAVYKTDECKKCYNRRKYLESTGRHDAWRMDRGDMARKIEALTKQLQTLAKRECDNCQERDCADCWANEFDGS